MSLHICSPGAWLALAGFLLSSGCNRFEGGGTTAPPRTISGISQDSVGRVPLGQIVGKPQRAVSAMSTRNPYEGNPQAVEQGKELYIRMNCAGCHAYSGKGNMGPNLTDTYWRYGGLPVQIYKTLEDGRPDGMPAWGVALPPDDIWKLVAYIQSLGGTVPASDYERARQGDQANTQVAPEAQDDAESAPVPVRVSPNVPAVMKKDAAASSSPGTAPSPRSKSNDQEP
jgi:cytochrome c oxidase cbb3-type subunit 3